MPEWLVVLLVACIRLGAAAPPSPENPMSEDLARPVAATALGIAPETVKLNVLSYALPFPCFVARNPGLGAGPRREQQGIALLVVDGEVLVGPEGFDRFLQTSWRKDPAALAGAWLYLYKGDPGQIRGKRNQDPNIPDPVFRGKAVVFTYTSAFNRTPTAQVSLTLGPDGTPTVEETVLP